MKSKASKFVLRALALSVTLAGATAPWAEERHHSVFVMTNDAEANEVIAYERTDIGTLVNPQRFKTGGRSSGGTVDPLASQGSLKLSQDTSLLFAVNAGSSGELAIASAEGTLTNLGALAGLPIASGLNGIAAN